MDNQLKDFFFDEQDRGRLVFEDFWRRSPPCFLAETCPIPFATCWRPPTSFPSLTGSGWGCG